MLAPSATFAMLPPTSTHQGRLAAKLGDVGLVVVSSCHACSFRKHRPSLHSAKLTLIAAPEPSNMTVKKHLPSTVSQSPTLWHRLEALRGSQLRWRQTPRPQPQGVTFAHVVRSQNYGPLLGPLNTTWIPKVCKILAQSHYK